MIPEPFTIDIPHMVIEDLRRRLRDTIWPDDLGNDDWSYGIGAAYLKDLVDYWIDGFDWSAVQARMNQFQHYRVMIDDVPIHFIRSPGKGPAPIPLILSHGWPWSFWDMQKVIGPLSDPAAHGGDPADAFDLIVPSLPGFTFSNPLTRPGMNFWKTSDLWHRLMTDVLGFGRYAAAGADWGFFVTQQLAHKYASSLYGVHITAVGPLSLFNAERFWDISATYVPADLTPEERAPLLAMFRKRIPHVAVQTIEPQTLAYGLHDSPVGLLAWLLQPRRDWGDCRDGFESAFPREHLVTTATLYWVTKCFANTARFYANAVRYPWVASHDRQPAIEAPAGITFLAGEFRPGQTLENRIEQFRSSPLAGYYNLEHVNVAPHGGHFAYYEAPEACVADIRTTFRRLRG